MEDSLSPIRSPELLSRGDSALLVIDAQEKLLPLIATQRRVVWNARRLIDGARLLNVHVAATEQYPQGLGPLAAELAERLPTIHEKRVFSCTRCGELIREFQSRDLQKILLAGIETHVCVLQTALDLLAEGFRVYVAADAVGARFDLDHQIALRRMDSAGVTLTTTESALFEWCESSSDPQFKQISALIRESPPGDN